jgi:uncharacterized lipoprotein YddW (UPF0748 family)
MKYCLISLLFSLQLLSVFASEPSPKHEFRGAWLHTVYQSQYSHNTTDQNKAYLRDQLDKLQKAGINVILFQVRPQADAFYRSSIEPWSKFLSGKAGVAPSPIWDPLEFMIEECHRRGMELHAWLNPYRVTTSAKEVLPAKHLYHKEPNRFVTYNKRIYFDPGLPENRAYIESIVRDIIKRYDVDGIHLDDYFYPYPVAGQKFPDTKSYERYGKGLSLADWRRQNIDLLIEQLHNAISEEKPWVRFGVSPFGIWRNKRNDSDGSESSGLQNYDDLYANIILWARNGWIDYQMPQLYWQLEHTSAPSASLAVWWNAHAYNRHVYIGQDVERTMKYPDINGSSDNNQLTHKVNLSRKLQNVQGNCWWPGYAVTANFGGIADSLSTVLQKSPALVPAYTWLSDSIPNRVERLSTSGHFIKWQAPEVKRQITDVVKWVIYCFNSLEAIDIDNADAITAIVTESQYQPQSNGYYVVTALNRVNVESQPSEALYFEVE